MELRIINASNGYIISDISEEMTTYTVAEENEGDEVGARMDLLHHVNCLLGEPERGGRYSPKRIRIICLPGDKHEGKLDKEYYQELCSLRNELISLCKEQQELGHDSIPAESDFAESFTQYPEENL